MYTYRTAGTYTVTLTVVNLTGVDVSRIQRTITVAPPPPSGEEPTPAPTPACVYPPDVIGKTTDRRRDPDGVSRLPDVTTFGELAGPVKGKIQAQDPDHTQCRALTTAVLLHYRASH